MPRLGETTNTELMHRIAEAFSTFSPDLFALLFSEKEAAKIADAKKAVEEVLKRESTKLEDFQNVDFKHTVKIGDRYYVLEIDCAAIAATDVMQVRVESYSSPKALETGFNFQLEGICDSVDEAVQLLNDIRKQSRKRKGRHTA